VREAGGYVTDAQGDQDMLMNGNVVAGNEVIHGHLLKTLGKPV